MVLEKRERLRKNKESEVFGFDGEAIYLNGKQKKDKNWRRR